MKATLLFATLSMAFATSQVSGKTELETLRARCAEQEEQIRELQNQLHTQRENQSATPAKTTTSTARTTTAAISNDSSFRTHLVKPGDNVGKIARLNRCSVSSIIKINKLKPTAIIHPGQRLKLPSNTKSKPTPAAKEPTTVTTNPEKTSDLKSAPLREPTSTPTSNTLASNQATTPVSSENPHPPAAPSSKSKSEKKIRSIKIENVMTYGQFASKHGTDTKRLNELNGLDLTNETPLAKGSELYVPAQP